MERKFTQRPLTLEEFMDSVETPVWFESHGTYMGRKGWWMIPQKIIKIDRNLLIKFVCTYSSQSSELGLDAYNEVWRAWKTKPTDEEREAATWKCTEKVTDGKT